MQQKAQGVSLRGVLRQAFASLSASECECPAGRIDTPAVVPLARTAGDRSRMRQKVLEELAQRRVRRQSTANGSSGATPPAQESLSAGDVDLFGRVEEPPASSAIDLHAIAPSVSPRVLRGARSDLRDLVEMSYRSLMRALPEEHVILNPLANAEFIIRCRKLGATVSEVALNRVLLNNRKAKRHADVLRAPVCRLSAGTFERIGHAVEMAASLVQRERFAVTNAIPSVDDMLCDPEQRRALGVYVSALHEDVDVVDCHLVLLAFRKSGRETSARLAGLSLPERSLFAPLRSLDPSDVPECGGVYRVLCKRRPVFVSSAPSLRGRLREHLERGGAELLPRSLPFQIDGPLSVEVFKLPKVAPRSELAALTRRLRLARTEDHVVAPPDLNWRETGALFGSHECVVRRHAMAG